VATKDGQLIASHEPKPHRDHRCREPSEFASRRRTAVVDGAAEVGFFASDFTLAEIKRLRRVQDFSERPQQFNGKFEIPTFEEIIALAKRKAVEKGRAIGIYPETSTRPTTSRSACRSRSAWWTRSPRRGWNRRDAPVFLQSFEPSSLKELRKLSPVRSVQLVDANDVNPDGSLDFTAPFDRPFDWTASGDPRLRARTFAFSSPTKA